ncbi:hypothetical protein B0H13DRAFT_2104811 [Mycena leptocephala]|nr:hypothetical protein B0H13DRAFT_2104811 [Mycena leptocephala]
MPVPGLGGTTLDTVDGDASGSGSEWEDVDDGMLAPHIPDDDGGSINEDEAEDEFTADPNAPALVLPDAPLAGHLYTVSGDGVASPPPETTAPNEGAPPNSFTVNLISSLTALPPALESIRFLRSEFDTLTARHAPPTLAEQHHAVLTLERACASESATQMLREIEFETTISSSEPVHSQQRIWRRVRDGGVDVWSQRYVLLIPPSFCLGLPGRKSCRCSTVERTEATKNRDSIIVSDPLHTCILPPYLCLPSMPLSSSFPSSILVTYCRFSEAPLEYSPV